ncbi:unnamed protein product [Closterium sp. NIES-64]|nr:unnamed protein product [Closterium sp. NIES-64]
MHSRYLVSGLPRVLPPLPPSPAPPCLSCVEGRQRAAPHSSSFRPTTAPLQTLHMDVWGPARVRGQGQERYFLIVVDDYSRYTTVFPLRTKGEVPDVLIPWIRRARLQLSERFHSDFPVLRLHSDRGGEFSSDLLAAYCAEHGIEQSFTLPASPQQNGVAERRIGLVMEVARTSLIHAAAPHFLWLFAVRYAAHQLNLWPRVSLPETSPTLLWTGEVGDASRFPGAAVVDPLPPQGAAHSGVSQVDPVEPVEVAVDSRPAGGAEPGGAETGGAEPGGAETGGAEPGGAGPGGAETGGAEPGGAETGGAGPGGGEPGGAEPGGAEPGGAEPQRPESGCSESGGAEQGGLTPGGALSSEHLREWYLQYCSLRRGTSGARRTTGTGASASPPSWELPSRERIREWYERRCTLWSGAPGVADPAAAGGATGAGDSTGAADPGVGVAAGTEDPSAGAAAGAEDPGVGAPAGAADPGVGAAAGAADPGVGAAAGAADPGAGAAAGAVESGVGAAAGAEDPGVGAAAGTEDPGAGVSAGSGVAARQRPYFVPLLQKSQLPSASSLPGPAPYTGPTGGLTERREPGSRPASPESRRASPVCAVLTGGRIPSQSLPAVPGTHRMALRPSTVPQRVPLPSPTASSLPAVADPGSDFLRAASPTLTRFLAIVVTDPSFESAAASAIVAELVDFAAACRLDYAASLVAESESFCPPSVRGECALGMDVLEDRQEDFQCLAAASPHLSLLFSDALDIQAAMDALHIQAAMDAEMASWKSTGTYVDAVPPRGANIISGMWIFRVKRLPGSPPVFKAPAHRDYELHSLDFSTAFLQGSLHEEIWLRRPLGFTGTFPPGTQWSLRRPVYGLRQAPREWHDTLRTTLAALGFAPSTADPSLFLRTDTSLPPFYILVCVDDLIFATADTARLAHVKSELHKRHTCTDLGELRSYLGLQITRDRAHRTITLTQSHMVQQVLQRFDFTYSSPQATPLPTRHSLSALPSDESVESSGPAHGCSEEGVALLVQYVGHGASAWRAESSILTGHGDASWADDQATQRSSQGYTFSLGSGSVSWWATRSSSVLGSSCEAEIYAGAMAAQELRWLTYLLTDLGEPPRSPPILYIDNKAMLALCREQRLEHRTKHIALRYFLARELQQRGQLRLAYVASEANTADFFTKALAPCDYQRFCTQLGLVPVFLHLLTS